MRTHCKQKHIATGTMSPYSDMRMHGTHTDSSSLWYGHARKETSGVLFARWEGAYVRVFSRTEGVHSSERPHVLDAVAKRSLVLLLHDDAGASTKAAATATRLATRFPAIRGVHHLMQNLTRCSCSTEEGGHKEACEAVRKRDPTECQTRMAQGQWDLR